MAECFFGFGSLQVQDSCEGSGRLTSEFHGSNMFLGLAV